MTKKTGRNDPWSQAKRLAARTPESRNRYVDFLRAVSICAVVFGHWLMAAPYVDESGIHITSMLEHQQWTRWLTWAFQVMPVFFLVGGYSNSISWQSALGKGRTYSEWLQVRLQRLIGPVLPLIVMWIFLAAGAQWLGMRPEMAKVASQMALIPIWFLAVYVIVVVLVPFTFAAWQKYRFWSFGILVIAAAIDDYLFFAADLTSAGWLNYAFVWLAVHQLGYAWRDGFMAGPKLGLAWVIGGGAVLIGLTAFGPYPISMVSVPGQEISNSLPPKLSMLTLGIAQCGLLLSIENPMRRWLSRITPWTAVVLINSMIMTVFLWHLTASTLAIGGAMLFNDIGLTVQPGSGTWWALRPVWIFVYLLALLPFALGFGRFERSAAGTQIHSSGRLVAGAVLACAGLASLALNGVVGGQWLGLQAGALILPFAGALLAGINPLRK
ncbi:MAG: acyltransferase [Xanthomonadales bacterium]|nr:acyltransferase [Gammaproteobacteria bacterium]MBT8054240.1 acyltransferase [Gammaproteobacteria bacterium]NND57567.1 acyltransferase [Xanthomonadales bacterium]NNK51291.1 acyltransferase [Xanthomonadales bacterium]